jgi:hypothetical protein
VAEEPQDRRSRTSGWRTRRYGPVEIDRVSSRSFWTRTAGDQNAFASIDQHEEIERHEEQEARPCH